MRTVGSSPPFLLLADGNPYGKEMRRRRNAA
jgi:hypothetical protein